MAGLDPASHALPSRANTLYNPHPMTRTNRPRTAHLPKNVSFPKAVGEVSILRDGPTHNIVPANTAWDDFFNSPGIDLSPREQPEL
jgi:antitoxin VapB